MSVSDKVTLSGPGAYIASLERELASMRASRDALAEALEGLLPQTFTGNPSRAELVAHWERERDLGNGNAPFVLAAYAALADHAKKGEAS
jgi:hypothetical protein